MVTIDSFHPNTDTGTNVRASVLKLLFAGFFLLFLVFTISSIWMYSRHDLDEYDKVVQLATGVIPAHQRREAYTMESVLKAISVNERFRLPFQAGDRDRLLTAARPFFKLLGDTHGFSHFYFHRLDRSNFLRVHKPDHHDDTIDRFTLSEAQRLDRPVSGIELGAMGTLTLRVVMPWYHQGVRIGYLELGKEIDRILDEEQMALGVRFETFLDKKFLDRATWEAGMASLGRPSDWERFPNLVATRENHMIDAKSLRRYLLGQRQDRVGLLELFFTGRNMVYFKLPIDDARGREVGWIVAEHDHSLQSRIIQTHLLSIGIACICIASLLIGLYYWLLGGIEKRLARANAGQRWSEQRFRAIFDNTSAMVFLKNLQGRYLLVNRQFEKLLGLSNEAIQGRRDQDIFPADIAETLGKNDSEVIDSRKPREKEERLPLEDELKTFVSIRFPLLDDQGRIQAVGGIATDISQRIRMEEHNARLARIIERSANEIYLFDAHTLKFSMVNRRAAENIGHGPEELRTMTPLDLMVDQTSADLARSIQPLRDETETFLDIETELQRRDGSRYIVSGKLQLMREEEPPVFVAIVEDITERRHIEQNLHLKEAALEATANDIVITDADGRIQWVNPSFTETTGYTLEEVLGENPRILKSGAQNGSFYQELWQTIHSGRVWKGVFINKRKDGGLYNDEATITPVFNRDGRIVNFVAVKQDVTQRIRTEQEMEKAKRRAESASRAKSDFLAVMSHEIRTPMNGILGMTELMLDLKLPDSARGYLGAIKNSGESLLDIINDILDFTKIEEGKVAIERVPIEPRSMINELSEPFTEAANRKNIHFEQSLHAEIPQRILGDPTRLRQILVNLIANAIKFTEEGRVTFTVNPVITEKNRVHLLFQVRDTGIGIKPEQMSRIFDSFEQADSTTTRKYGGTGLGLAITRKLVTLMNGTLEVDSTPDRGSVFQVTLPFGLPAADAMESDAGTAAMERKTTGIAKRSRILVVEDDPINRTVIKGMLRRHELLTDFAENGLIALEKLKNNRYELVLMDIQMPEMDGFEVTKNFRIYERAREDERTPTVALTAYVMKGDRERCLSAGMDDHLGKPVSNKELTEALSQWLPA